MKKNFARDFVSDEQRNFKAKIGTTLASSLSGFIAGVVFATLIFGIALYLVKLMIENPF